MTELREKVARALAEADPEGAGDPADRVNLYLAEADAAIATVMEMVREPSEAVWDGLPRQIMMWLDMGPRTPRALFKHLERSGYEVPQWLRDELEMQALDHVPSKGTRCVIIWKAMLSAFKETSNGQ